MNKQVLRVGLLLTIFLFTASLANADSAMVPFPTAGDYYCSLTNGCGNLPSGGQTAYMWSQGDYVVSSNFTGTGLGSVNGLSYDFQVFNVIGGGNSETVDILLNNNVVGDFVVPDCNYCGSPVEFKGTLSFPTIGPLNGGYTLEMELTNTLPVGGGSIAFMDGGEFTLSSSGSTPEPGTILLFGTGALGLAGVLRRKINL
jgi:hypothetical protein